MTSRVCIYMYHESGIRSDQVRAHMKCGARTCAAYHGLLVASFPDPELSWAHVGLLLEGSSKLPLDGMGGR